MRYAPWLALLALILMLSACQRRGVYVPPPARVMLLGDSLFAYGQIGAALEGRGYTVALEGRPGWTWARYAYDPTSPLRDPSWARAVGAIDVTIVMLGTNDADSWLVERALVAAEDVVLRLRGAFPGVPIVLCLPPSGGDASLWGDRPTVDWRANLALLERGLRELDVDLVVPLTLDASAYSPTDAIHPSDEGYSRLAAQIAEALGDQS